MNTLNSPLSQNVSFQKGFGISLSFLKAFHYKNIFESVKAHKLLLKNFSESIKGIKGSLLSVKGSFNSGSFFMLEKFL